MAHIAGYHCPVIISRDDLVEVLQDRYNLRQEDAELMADYGGATMAEADWSNESNEASDAAIEEAERWASENGIELTPI